MKTVTKMNYMNLQQIAKRLSMSVFTVRRMCGRDLAFTRIGAGRGRIVVTEDQFNDYLQRRTVRAEAA